MSIIKKFLAQSLCPAFGLCTAVLLALNPVSCVSMDDSIDVLTGDFTSPKIESFKILSSTRVEMNFSKPVEIKNTEIFGQDSPSVSLKHFLNYENDSKKVCVVLKDGTDIGTSYVVEGKALDKNGNSVTFSIPFVGYNENPARVILSEIRPTYGYQTSGGIKYYRVEFVELYVLESGNLCGLEVVSAYDGDKMKFTLPSIYVQKGEYITLHYRNVIDENGNTSAGIVSELGDELNLSSYLGSCDSGRDLWNLANTSAVLGTSDAVVLRNFYDQKILDAVVYNESKNLEWKKSLLPALVEIAESGLWKYNQEEGGISPDAAVCSDGLSSATKSISRQNIAEIESNYSKGMKIISSKSDWALTEDSGRGENAIKGVTPGAKNYILD